MVRPAEHSSFVPPALTNIEDSGLTTLWITLVVI
jgi:hypothetical protein